MKKELYKEKIKLKEVEIEDTSSFVKICCPSCSADIPGENININDKIAKCNDCAIVFPFQKELDQVIKPESKSSQKTLRPEGVDVFEFKGRHEISVTQPITDLELISLFILSIIVFVCFVRFMDFGLSILYLGGSILAVLAYLFSFLNRHTHKVYFDIDQEFMHVKWRPKKLKSDKSYRLKDIKQLYVKEKQLYMIVDGIDGSKHINLLSHMTSTPKVHFLEQEIERYLRISDEDIAGED